MLCSRQQSMLLRMNTVGLLMMWDTFSHFIWNEFTLKSLIYMDLPLTKSGFRYCNSTAAPPHALSRSSETFYSQCCAALTCPVEEAAAVRVLMLIAHKRTKSEPSLSRKAETHRSQGNTDWKDQPTQKQFIQKVMREQVGAQLQTLHRARQRHREQAHPEIKKRVRKCWNKQRSQSTPSVPPPEKKENNDVQPHPDPAAPNSSFLLEQITQDVTVTDTESSADGNTPASFIQ